MRARAVTAAICILIAFPAPASGWSNGVEGPDSYGTHDLVLDRAVRALRARGGGAGWVRLTVALRATDDPDTKDGIPFASSPWWHVYDRWGSTYGDAHEAAEHWFDRAVSALRRDRRRAASRALGFLAHIVADVANPMHTDQSEREESLHSPYERDVDRRSERTDRVYRFGYDGRDPAHPRRRTVRVARVAHRYYDDLVRVYDRHGYNDRVHRLTRRQLKRATNAIADLIVEIRRAARA